METEHKNSQNLSVQTAATPMDMLLRADIASIDTDKLDKLMTLQERWEQNEARKAFAAAMSRAQEQLPVVVKNADNEQTRSKYAKEDAITKAIKPIYTKEGFSLSFDTDDSPLEGHIRVICAVMHSAGHTERKHIDYPYDLTGIQGKPNKTKIHAYKSTISYARSTLTCMAFNVATGDDDDGQAASEADIPIISDKQASQLLDLIEATGSDLGKFLRWVHAESIETMPAKHFAIALSRLESKLEEQEQE